MRKQFSIDFTYIQQYNGDENYTVFLYTHTQRMRLSLLLVLPLLFVCEFNSLYVARIFTMIIFMYFAADKFMNDFPFQNTHFTQKRIMEAKPPPSRPFPSSNCLQLRKVHRFKTIFISIRFNNYFESIT